MTEQVDVLVVGAGPAGLTAARELMRRGVGTVVVLDRESEAGGIPRHSDHTGYGLRDLRRLTTGPRYARHLVEAARASGADLRTATMATGWEGRRTIAVTSPDGRQSITARAIILATGARERSRAARFIAGDRPAGVFTTGQLQNEVHLQRRHVGSRAVVVGGELVSWSAVLTLREAGCATALMTSEWDSDESYAAVPALGRLALRVPVASRTRVVRILGRERVTGVELEHLDTGQRREFACDAVVVTGDWIPDYELARAAGLTMDPVHRGPVVDSALRTSQPGIFAAGNLLHPVDTADVAAIDGRHVAAQVARYLDGTPVPEAAVHLQADEPFLWVAPGLIRPGDPAPARDRLLLWSTERRRMPQVTARQDGRVIGRLRLPWPVAPGRMVRIPAALVRGMDPRGGDIRIGLG